MKSVQIDDGTAQRLRLFLASRNSGHIHGKIGITAALAINRYINQEEKYTDDLAKKALGVYSEPKKYFKEENEKGPTNKDRGG